MNVVGIYDDRLAFLRKLGPVSVKRVSHVEPSGDQWTADMSPVGGPVLGPFDTRAQALESEKEWLRQSYLPRFGTASQTNCGRNNET